jgi:hypothetical protein
MGGITRSVGLGGGCQFNEKFAAAGLLAVPIVDAEAVHADEEDEDVTAETRAPAADPTFGTTLGVILDPLGTAGVTGVGFMLEGLLKYGAPLFGSVCSCGAATSSRDFSGDKVLSLESSFINSALRKSCISASISSAESYGINDWIMSIHLQSTSESTNTKGIQLLVRFSIHMHIKKRAVAQTTHIRIHFLGSDPHGLDGCK